MQKHFVRFFSPGTFFDEETEKPIDAWDTEIAQQMAHGIVERYEATPFAFRFVTYARGDDDLDSKRVASSPTYYLGGRIETRAEIEARNDPSESILRSNLRMNNVEKVLINTNSWKTVRPLLPTDVILDWKPLATAKSGETS